MSVEEWCHYNCITKSNYYRLHRVKEACLETLSNDKSMNRIVPVKQTLLMQDVRSDCGLDISYKNCSIHVHEAALMGLLFKVLVGMQDAQ